MSSTVSFRIRRSSSPTAHDPGDVPPGSWPETGPAASVQALEALGELAGGALLGAGERLQPLRDLLEALVARGLREAGVHLGVLIGLTGDGRVQVVGGRTDGNAGHRVADFGQEVEVPER